MSFSDNGDVVDYKNSGQMPRIIFEGKNATFWKLLQDYEEGLLEGGKRA